MKIMEFGLKWVHMGRYGVLLRLDGALWLTIIFRPLLTQKRANYQGHLEGKAIALSQQAVGWQISCANYLVLSRRVSSECHIQH